MKREDFEPDDLQGMLIAYLDNQLVGQEKKDFEDLLSRHEDLQADLEIYKITSSKLTELFDMDGVETPLSVEQKIRQASAFGESVLQSSQTPETERAIFEPSEKIASFAAAKEKRRRFFSFQGITQMAAALALGVAIGPGLMDQLKSSDGDKKYREALKLRGTADLPEINDTSAELADRTIGVSELIAPKTNKDGIFIVRLPQTDSAEAGEASNRLSVGEKIDIYFYPPRDGQVTIKYEGFNKVGDLKLSETLVQETSSTELIDRKYEVPSFKVPNVSKLDIVVDISISDSELITYEKSFVVN